MSDGWWPFFFVLIAQMDEEQWLSEASAEYAANISNQKRNFNAVKMENIFSQHFVLLTIYITFCIWMNECLSYSYKTIIAHWTNFYNSEQADHPDDRLKHINIPPFFLLSLLYYSTSNEYFRFILLDKKTYTSDKTIVLQTVL